MTRTALVFGGSGQIGAPLLDRLRGDGWRVTAVSRDAQIDDACVRWLRGDLSRVERLPEAVDAIFSCGPLDHFARWYANSTLACPRVVAFGSTEYMKRLERAEATVDFFRLAYHFASKVYLGYCGPVRETLPARSGCLIVPPTLTSVRSA